MQKNRFTVKRFWGLICFITVISLVTFISSCNQGGKKSSSNTACLTLTMAQLDNWFPAYSDPNAPLGNKMSVVEFFPSYDAGTKTYSVSVKGYNGTSAQLGNALSFSEGTGCVLPEPPPTIGQHYQVYVADLNILKADGSLLDGFESLMLTPQTSTDGQLKFEVSANVDGTTIVLMIILPCPPCLNCRPPCPDDCTPACDSLISFDSNNVIRDTSNKMSQ